MRVRGIVLGLIALSSVALAGLGGDTFAGKQPDGSEIGVPPPPPLKLPDCVGKPGGGNGSKDQKKDK